MHSRMLLSGKSSNEGLLSGDEGSNGFCTPRVTTFIPSGDESAQRATRDESCYEGGAKPLASRVKPDSNAITTAAFAICNGKQ